MKMPAARAARLSYGAIVAVVVLAMSYIGEPGRVNIIRQGSGMA